MYWRKDIFQALGLAPPNVSVCIFVARWAFHSLASDMASHWFRRLYSMSAPPAAHTLGIHPLLPLVHV
jgi:hypothetical protein